MIPSSNRNKKSKNKNKNTISNLETDMDNGSGLKICNNVMKTDKKQLRFQRKNRMEPNKKTAESENHLKPDGRGKYSNGPHKSTVFDSDGQLSSLFQKSESTELLTENLKNMLLTSTVSNPITTSIDGIPSISPPKLSPGLNPLQLPNSAGKNNSIPQQFPHATYQYGNYTTSLQLPYNDPLLQMLSPVAYINMNANQQTYLNHSYTPPHSSSSVVAYNKITKNNSSSNKSKESSIRSKRSNTSNSFAGASFATNIPKLQDLPKPSFL